MMVRDKIASQGNCRDGAMQDEMAKGMLVGLRPQTEAVDKTADNGDAGPCINGRDVVWMGTRPQ